MELVRHFGFSPERRRILRGLIAYRTALAAGGFTQGFQLIDGSFSEDCEGLRNRPPSDIDILSYLEMPADYAADLDAYRNVGVQFLMTEMMGRPAKETFAVDAYLV